MKFYLYKQLPTPNKSKILESVQKMTHKNPLMMNGVSGLFSSLGNIYITEYINNYIQYRPCLDDILKRFMNEDYGDITDDTADNNVELKYLGNGTGMLGRYPEHHLLVLNWGYDTLVCAESDLTYYLPILLDTIKQNTFEYKPIIKEPIIPKDPKPRIKQASSLQMFDNAKRITECPDYEKFKPFIKLFSDLAKKEQPIWYSKYVGVYIIYKGQSYYMNRLDFDCDEAQLECIQGLMTPYLEKLGVEYYYYTGEID